MSGRNHPKPKDVFDNPENFLDFLTVESDREFEGQLFDRKELCRASGNGHVSNNDVKKFKAEHVAQTLSAFANSNTDGGLLVLGIASNGQVEGLEHLNENQVNSLLTIDNLVHHNSDTKIQALTVGEDRKEIALIYTPYVPNAICETLSNPRRAWLRRAAQNIELMDNDKERIKRDKRIVDFEKTHCSQYEAGLIDNTVYDEFVKSYLDNSSYDRSQEDVLNQIGAIQGAENDSWLTNSGSLFFAANPEKDTAQAYIRLLRFDVPYEDRENRSNPTYDKKFSGPITKQIRDFRTFIKESALFETYQRRDQDGGFVEEPEYPAIAIDEAVVNAVAHRDYAITKPILCEKYTDAFIVVSPGSIIQNSNLPDYFSLEDTRLEHHSRNPKIMEWLRLMKDARGSPFVLALQEGTRRMRDEMAKLGLPAPEYLTSDFDTKVILRNNAAQRKDLPLNLASEETTEFTNMYPITGLNLAGGYDQSKQIRGEVMAALKNKLSANGWFIDKFSFGRITAHRKGISAPTPNDVSKIVKLYPSYEFQIREYFGKPYLLVDYTVIVQSVLFLSKALEYFDKEELIGLKCTAQMQGWSQGRISNIEIDHSKIRFFDYESEEAVTNDKIIPKLNPHMVANVFKAEGVRYDISKEIKKVIFGFDKNASRKRAEYTQVLVDDLIKNIFPLKVSSSVITVSNSPLRLSAKANGKKMLRLDSLKEPQVEFSKQRSSADVREGITSYGAYENAPKNIEIVPMCANAYARSMEGLIERLRSGKFKFKGTERTFGVKLTYNTVINEEPNDLEQEIERLLNQHPEWKGNAELSRLFLIHCPEAGHAIDDETSPYYMVKRKLLEAGIPCQMVDTPTLENPDFKDLNLALNIVAKCGQTPWVLPESIPDCDFFIGLSYTQNRRRESKRLMAFANVFNQYGRWEFYSGGSEVFSYEQRTDYYEQLVKDTLSKLTLSEEPTICFHYTAKFSREDKAAILKAAKSIRPNGTFVFVWINTHHNVRLYDSSSETNGSLSRGQYVIGGTNQIYLSTTGHNPYRKMLGTPQALELNIQIENTRKRNQEPDLRVLASQMLSLTKLNWASTDSLCAEPITTKYAGDIAYLTAAFLRQGNDFKLHPVLEKTPWFI